MAAIAVFFTLLAGCVTAQQSQHEPVDMRQRGMASWYGEEFAGRTTANGEIFDPLLLTAAHRTLPFGTVVEVKNVKTGQLVLVRINDRGPFVGNRLIDLSYAAAEKIGLANSGVGEVELRVLKVGAGDREPPAPLVVDAGQPPHVATKKTSAEPPPVDFPLPADVEAEHARPGDDAVVDRVDVVEERGGVEVRKQVAADGRTIVDAPVDGGPPAQPSASALDEKARREKQVAPPSASRSIVVQLGAFSSEENANELARRAREVVSHVYVEKYHELNRVRVGPFATREAAVEAKEKLDAAGVSAIVVVE